MHPFVQRHLVVHVHQVELNQEVGDASSELYLTLSVGAWKVNTATVPQRSSKATWAETFIVREDDMTMSAGGGTSSNSMAVSFELNAAKRWPVPDIVFAACELSIEEEVQARLIAGEEAIARIPLQPPGRLHQRLRAGVSSSSASSSSTSSAQPSSSSLGVLFVSIRLQLTALDDALGGQLPGDLIPALTVDATEASGLAPGSVIHTPIGNVFVEPTFVYLRIKLLAISGLKHLPNPPKPAPGALDPQQKISAANAAAADQAARGGGETVGGTISQMASQIVEGWTKQALSTGLSWAKAKIASSSPTAPSDVAGSGTNNTTTSSSSGTNSNSNQQQQQQPGQAPRTSAGGAKRFASLVSSFAKKGLSAAVLASADKTRVEENELVPMTHSLDPPPSTPAKQAKADEQDSSTAATLGLSPESRPPSSDEEIDGVKVSPPSPPSPPAAGDEEDEYHLPNEATTSPPNASTTPDPTSLPPPLATAGNSSSPSSPHVPHTSPRHEKSVDFDVLMGVLETNGFSSTDKGVFQYFWLRAAYEGQEHTTKMVQQRKGSASWEAHGEHMLVSALRPVGASPIEFSLYGTRDPKSKGRVVAQVSLPLSQLLAAASIHRYRPPKSAAVVDCQYYDPLYWPRGKVAVKGKLEDGSNIELLFEVVLVEGDERGKDWGLPLILREGVAITTSSSSSSSSSQKATEGQAIPHATSAETILAASGWTETLASLPSPPPAATSSSKDLTWMMPKQLPALHRSSLGTLHFIVHSVVYYTSERSLDTFFLSNLGHIWCMSAPQSSRSPSWGLHVQFPLHRLSDVLSFACFRKNVSGGEAAMSIGKKAIGGASSTRSVVGELIGLTGPGGAIGGGILVGKMRIRASSLAPGRLHTVDLPIQGERQQSKAAQCTGHATVSLWLELGNEGSCIVPSSAPPPSPPPPSSSSPTSPDPVSLAATSPPPSLHQRMMGSWPSRLASAYLATPRPWPPVLLLAMGCSPGDDIRSPYLGSEDLAYDVDKDLMRRSVRVVIGALEQRYNPGIPGKAALRLLDDGRQEFTLSRTKENWMRCKEGIRGLTQPPIEAWKEIRSWRNPLKSSVVAVLVVLWAMLPQAGTGILLIALSALLVARRPRWVRPMTQPVAEAFSGGGRQRKIFPISISPRLDAALTYCNETISKSAFFRSIFTPSPLAPPFGSPMPMLDTIESADPAAQQQQAEGGNPPGADQSPAPPSTPNLPAPSPPPNPSSSSSSSAVPMDAFDLMKSQYEGLVAFLSLSQNVLDSVAILVERILALLSWQDPYATTLFVILLVIGALLIWVLGIPWLIALSILSDIRPPRWRDPLPSPLEILFKQLPTLGDRMM